MAAEVLEDDAVGLIRWVETKIHFSAVREITGLAEVVQLLAAQLAAGDTPEHVERCACQALIDLLESSNVLCSVIGEANARH